MTKRRKFYKYTLVPLFSLVLSFVLIGKSAEAASTTMAAGVGTGTFNITAWQATPENVDPADTLNNPGTQNSYYSYTGATNLTIYFDSNSGVSSEYRGGYLNGVFTLSVQFPITFSQAVSNIRCTALYNGIQTDTVSCSCVSLANISSGVAMQFVVTLNNYSLVINGGNLREINLGSVEFNYSAIRTADGSYPLSTCTPTITSHNGGFTATATAVAGQGVAGQLYTAIENSSSVSDIVAYLSAIEDASGDINVAVSHINETLLPNVITYLQSLIANTNLTNTKLNTLINYLNVISSNWPQYSAQVLFYLSQLVNMNEEQSSLAAEVESQYQAKAAEGAQLNQGMQVVIPTVNQDSFNINSNVDSGTVTTLSAFWALFPANALIGTLFAIAIAGIAAGFFLYGKKR